LLNLEHLGTQPDLSVLRAERNLIDDFYGTERCPKLKEVFVRAYAFVHIDDQALTTTSVVCARSTWMAILLKERACSTL